MPQDEPCVSMPLSPVSLDWHLLPHFEGGTASEEFSSSDFAASGPGGMLHLFGGWYCFLFPFYLWAAQLREKAHNRDPTIAPWLTSWKMSSLSRYCCASWELLMISSQLRAWRPVLRTVMFAEKGLMPRLCSQTQCRCVLIPTDLKIDCWDGGRVLLHG